MPCRWIKVNGVDVHINAPGPRRERCQFCGRLDHLILCDAPRGLALGEAGATCDAKACTRCALHAGDNLDYCPKCIAKPEETNMANWNFKSDAEMNAAGYHFSRCGFCRGCAANIEWWRTPQNKMMPLDRAQRDRNNNAGAVDDAAPQPHWVRCTARDQFRRERAARPAPSGEPAEASPECGMVLHACTAVGCKQRIQSTYLMCGNHWRMVPEPLQRAVWAQYRRCQEKRLNPLADKPYMAARQAAINVVAKKEGVRIA
jgi:hypothetical protein